MTINVKKPGWKTAAMTVKKDNSYTNGKEFVKRNGIWLPSAPPNPFPNTIMVLETVLTQTTKVAFNFVGTTFNDYTIQWLNAAKAVLGQVPSEATVNIDLPATTRYVKIIPSIKSVLTARLQLGYNSVVKSILQFDSVGFASAEYPIMTSTILASVPQQIPPSVRKLNGVFQLSSVFNDPLVSAWDVSKITEFNLLFSSATAFNQPLNNWNTSNAVSMRNTIAGASAFNRDISMWNVNKVTDWTGFAAGTSIPSAYLPPKFR